MAFVSGEYSEAYRKNFKTKFVDNRRDGKDCKKS